MGCTHGCAYCFANRNRGTRHPVKVGEGAESLTAFIAGKRNKRTNWVDWKLPIHWGGLSDGFQPIERKLKRSLKCLEVFAETGYPVVISTKGRLIVEQPYLGLLAKCKAVVQLSIVAKSYDDLEPRAPDFKERLSMFAALKHVVLRTIARMQPMQYERDVVREVCRESIPAIAKTGCHGVVVDGWNSTQEDETLNTKIGRWLTYPDYMAKPALLRIKRACHKHGMKFYCGDERFRSMGDSLNCCGTNGVPGFRSNHCNLNHAFYGGYEATPGQQKPNTAAVFGAIPQNAAADEMLSGLSFAQMMGELAKVRDLQADYRVAAGSGSLFGKMQEAS